MYPTASAKEVAVMHNWVFPAAPPPPDPPVFELNAQQLQDITEMFIIYDKDKSGTISVQVRG